MSPRASRFRRSAQGLSAQAGALSLAFHVAVLAGFSVLIGDLGTPQRLPRVVTLEMLPPTEVVAASPDPIDETDELSEAVDLLMEDPLEDPETVTQVFPPEPPEPEEELDPLPFDDPNGVKLRVAPFSELPVEKPELVVMEEAPPPPAEPEAPAAAHAEAPGPTRGPILVQGREPEYPVLSKRLGEEGSVLCRLFVDADGSVSRVELVRSSGSTRLDRAALEALRRWRFVGALEKGLFVPSEFTHTVRFRLK